MTNLIVLNLFKGVASVITVPPVNSTSESRIAVISDFVPRL